MKTTINLSQEVFNEQISALMDNELEAKEAKQVLDYLKTDEGKKAWSRYHAISDALHADSSGAASSASTAGFMNRFSERLAKEPQILAPSWGQKAIQSVKRAHRIVPVLATAATVAALSWFVVPHFQAMQTNSGQNAPTAVGNGPDAPGTEAVTDDSAAPYMDAHEQYSNARP